MIVCPNCGEENPDRFRLCGSCGTKLAPDLPSQVVRKTVTIVFCDLKGSTSLGEKLDTESMREVLRLYFQELRGALERHGGVVEKYIGDAIMAVFGLPRLHEDDALRAVRAAAEMKDALARVNERLLAGWGVALANRTGVNTGEVVAGDISSGQRLVTGDAVNVAARLEQSAPEMEVLIGESTYRLVKGAVEVEPVPPLVLKGKAEPVPAYRLIGVSREEGVARRLDAPMVGRTRELEVLSDALQRALEGRTPQLVTVFGPAGVGKSRLLREFVGRSAPQTTALRGRCLSYGDGITFWPLAEVTRQAAGIADADSLEEAGEKLTRMLGEEEGEVADRVAAALGLSTAPFPIQETYWAAKRVFEILSRKGPLLVLIDDIHWAEPAFLDLVRFVVDSAADAPLVLVCSSRQDLLETHPDWAEERENARTVTLQPLSEGDMSLVVENHLGGALDAAARTRIIAAAEGNPLFVEQLLSMLIDDGALSPGDRGGWVLARGVPVFTIPPSIHALLTARLDLLGQTDRAVIERGAVVGQTFFRGAVEELVPEMIRDHVGAGLLTLERKELIRPDESPLAGHDAFRFLHVLIREAAYRGLLKRTRAELHERFVDWVERQASDRVTEFEEIRGYHLEQAYLILSQLGSLDEHSREVGARGAGYLSSTGYRALARGDLHAAAGLLGRAAALLPDEDPSRPRLLLHAGEALFEQGEFSEAGAKLGGAADAAAAIGDRGLETTARMSRRQLRYATEGGGTDEQVEEELEAAIATLEEIGDQDGLARACRFLADVRWAGCRYGAAEEAALRTIEHARLAGDRVMELRILPALAALALWGPMTAPHALALCEGVLEEAAGDRRAEALTLRAMAHLEAMLGRFDQARERYRRSRATLEELGWTFQAALTSINSGAVEVLAGDLSAAEAELRTDFLTLERMGERNFISTTAGFLADVLYQLGRYAEAQQLSSISEEVAALDDVSSQSLWRCVRAKVMAREGRLDEAEALARDGVSIIGGSDDPNSRGNALMDLAEVLRLAGKRDEAVAAAKESAELFAQKGNVVSAGRARAVLGELTGPGLPTPRR